MNLRLQSRGLLLASVFASAPAWSLDKQGSGHAGHTDVVTSGQAISGSLLLGAAVFNPSYAARPDNSGLALFRFAAHSDVDLIGQHLTIPLDVNVFTDRMQNGAALFVPSELDLIGGITSTWTVWRGSLELG